MGRRWACSAFRNFRRFLEKERVGLFWFFFFFFFFLRRESTVNTLWDTCKVLETLMGWVRL